MLNTFIQAEKRWEAQIKQSFNDLFDKCLWSIEKMADLSLVLDDRLKNSLNNKQLYVFYSMLQSEIFQWCDSLSADEYNKFCKLSNNSSIIKINLTR